MKRQGQTTFFECPFLAELRNIESSYEREIGSFRRNCCRNISCVVTHICWLCELRIARLQAGSDGFSNASDTTISVLALISDHADIWRKGCLDEDLLPDESIIFQKLIAAYSNRNFTSWFRANLGLTGASPERFARVQAMNRYRFPGFNRVDLETRRAMSPRFELSAGTTPWEDEVDLFYDELVESGAPKNVDVSYCGRM